MRMDLVESYFYYTLKRKKISVVSYRSVFSEGDRC